MPALEVEALRIAYRSAVAVDGVSFSVGAGAVLTVAGPNGAGKSSLLRAIAGTLGLAGGRIVDGRIAAEAPVRLVLEGRRVFADLTVAENLRTGALALPRADRSGRVEWAFDRFAVLAARRHVAAGHLSGGEQQVLAVARALVGRPAVLLLDEPTVGLARASAERVAAAVAESGAAVVVAEQVPVLFPAAEVLRLDRGRAVAADAVPA